MKLARNAIKGFANKWLQLWNWIWFFVYQFIIIIIYNQIHVFSKHNIYNKTTSSNLNMYKSNKYSSEVGRVFLLRIKYNLKVYADFDTRIV